MRLGRFAQRLRAGYLASLGLSFQPVLMAMALHRESCSVGRGPRNAPGSAAAHGCCRGGAGGRPSPFAGCLQRLAGVTFGAGQRSC